MASEVPAAPPGRGSLATQEDRRRRHADSQARYRARNLVDTRTKAQLRMERLRARIEMSEEESQLAAQRRRIVDADYRERCRKKYAGLERRPPCPPQFLTVFGRKFIAKFGHRAFMEQYLPLHQIFGDHIVGKKFVWDDEEKKEKNKQKKKKRKVAKAASKRAANETSRA
ncbi:hypothetical protein B0H11DRAFT_1910324 [Mycena galericulata]|nr:hypothetical protein B0H11DRAFT_1910324 [Mycena galericulata]